MQTLCIGSVLHGEKGPTARRAHLGDLVLARLPLSWQRCHGPGRKRWGNSFDMWPESWPDYASASYVLR